MKSLRSFSAWPRLWWVLPLVCAPLFFHLITTFGYDDPYITYRYAVNLAQGRGLTYNGLPEFSTTTPLWTLLLAFTTKLGLDVALVSNTLGVASILGAGIVLGHLLPDETPAFLRAACALCLIFCVGLSSTLGSEMPFYVLATVSTFLALRHKRVILAGVCTGLVILTRPDGVLCLVVALGLTWAHYGWRDALRLLGVASLFVVPWMLFLHAQTGLWAPTTLATKQAQGTFPKALLYWDGIIYLNVGYALWFGSSYTLLKILVVVGLWALRRHIAVGVPLFALIFAVAYINLKVCWYHWYLGPVYPGLILAIFWGIAAIVLQVRKWGEKLPARVTARLGLTPQASKITYDKGEIAVQINNRKAFQFLTFLPAFWVSAIAVLISFRVWQSLATEAPPARTKLYVRVGYWLRNNTPENATLGMAEVGILGFYSQRKIIDFAGILQPDVARSGGTSYQAWGTYALKKYRPDYMMMMTPPPARDGVPAYKCVQIFSEPGYTPLSIWKRVPPSSKQTSN